MSLIPVFFNELARPSRLLDQRFGVGLDWDDLLEPFNTGLTRRPPRVHYNRPWSTALSRADTGSTITADKDKFQIHLDVQQFAPNEISVKVTGDRTITVEGKHEEKEDEHGFISRHFLRRYVLPDGHDINNVVSQLSSDGVLNITAPRVEQGQGDRTIQIQHTGVPSKPIENKQETSEK